MIFFKCSSTVNGCSIIPIIGVIYCCALCTFIHSYIHTYVYTYIHTHTHRHTRIHACIHANGFSVYVETGMHMLLVHMFLIELYETKEILRNESR